MGEIGGNTPARVVRAELASFCNLSTHEKGHRVQCLKEILSLSLVYIYTEEHKWRKGAS